MMTQTKIHGNKMALMSYTKAKLVHPFNYDHLNASMSMGETIKKIIHSKIAEQGEKVLYITHMGGRGRKSLRGAASSH
jgi:hypothetical protein